MLEKYDTLYCFFGAAFCIELNVGAIFAGMVALHFLKDSVDRWGPHPNRDAAGVCAWALFVGAAAYWLLKAMGTPVWAL